MRAVGIKTLKNRLSEYLRIVASGETVLVVDRDRVVAELAPPQAGRAVALADANLAEAVRRGQLTPASLSSEEPPPSLPVAPLETVLEELDRDREDR
jgi:antitoxin (DNA-binding transcriptional repressor) of toxin-antitoxin stability system